MATHEVTFPITDPQEILKLRAGDEVIIATTGLGELRNVVETV